MDRFRSEPPQINLDGKAFNGNWKAVFFAFFLLAILAFYAIYSWIV